MFVTRLEAYQATKLKAQNVKLGVMLCLKPKRKIAKTTAHTGKIAAGKVMPSKSKPSALKPAPSTKIRPKIIAIKSHTLRARFSQNLHTSHTQTRAIRANKFGFIF